MKVKVYDYTGDGPVRHGRLEPSDNGGHDLEPRYNFSGLPQNAIRVRIDRTQGYYRPLFDWVEYEGGDDVLIPLEQGDER